MHFQAAAGGSVDQEQPNKQFLTSIKVGPCVIGVTRNDSTFGLFQISCYRGLGQVGLRGRQGCMHSINVEVVDVPQSQHVGEQQFFKSRCSCSAQERHVSCLSSMCMA